MKPHVVFILATTSMLLVAPRVHAQLKIMHGTFGSGGGIMEGADVSVQGTLGQSFIGMVQNNAYSVKAGFWYLAQPDITTSVEQTDDGIPREFRLDQNYPNPFNPSTTIRFALPKQEHVSLVVYDLLGRVVATLVDETMAAGEYSAVFEAGGRASGVYIYRIHTESYTATKRLVFIK
jgi:hypothetical protein